MFKKPKRNFRSRQKDSDDEPENGDITEDQSINVNDAKEDDSSQDSMVPLKKSKPKKLKKDKEGIERSSSTLSFQDDEGDLGEEFQIKKSSHSRRVAKQLKRASQKEKEEKEREERQRTENNEPKRDPYCADTLKKMRDDQNKENQLVEETMELASDQDTVSSDDMDDQPHKAREDSFKYIFESGQIPDANMIHLARKRRQMAREKGEEFIPIDDTEKYEKDKSRLVREDDNDASEEDEPINFSVNTSKDRERRHIQTTILAAAEESHSEGSDHDESWVEQQIRKGVQVGSGQGSTESGWNNSGTEYPQMYGQRGGFPSAAAPILPYPPVQQLSSSQNLGEITVDQVRKRLQQRLDELRSVHRVHTNELSDLEARLASCRVTGDNRQSSVRTLEEQYSFFQNMRGYVRDLVECLNEKMTAIVYLERCIHQLLKQRADKLVKRRQDDIKDESLLCSKGKASGVEAPSEAAEFMAQRRAAERDGRRSRRRRAREALSVADHYEGLSTDDEEIKSESTKFTADRAQAAVNAATLFEDVLEDFHELHLVKARFESWKQQQGDTYEEAYIGLCLPKLFTPLVRLKLSNWNPLEEESEDFEKMDWYETLMFYGSDGRNELNPRDNDNKLMSSLVEKVIVPKLTVLVETVYDPLSRSQTKRLVQTVNKLAENYPAVSADSKNTQTLLKAIITRLKKSLDEDVYIPLYSKQIVSAKTSQSSFFHRQCWSCIKFLCNILEWHGVIGAQCLQELAFDGLLNRYLVLGLFNSPPSRDTVAKCQMITEAIPDVWLADLDGGSTLPQLNNLCRILVNLAASLDSCSSISEKKYSREIIKFITRMLVGIHALDQAATLAEQFSFKV